MIPVLWLCGPPGVGKTAVAWEIYQRVQRAGADPAYVDVDQLGMCYPPRTEDPDRHNLKARNVAALRANFTASGARTLIVSGVPRFSKCCYQRCIEIGARVLIEENVDPDRTGACSFCYRH